MRISDWSSDVCSSVLVGSTGEARRAPETRSEVQLSFAPLVKAAAPAVVNIYTRRVVESRASPLFDDPFFRRFFGDMMMPEGQRRRIQNALSPGVIVAPARLHVPHTQSEQA